jgi:hypothetical protein
VTLSSVALIALLSLAAIADYRLVRWQSEVKIDQHRGDMAPLLISFDILFPRVPCYALNLDVMDGQTPVNNLFENIKKVRVSDSGKVLGEYRAEEGNDFNTLSECGSCFSKSDLESKPELVQEDEKNKVSGVCCNRCSSVFAAYAARGQPAPVVENVSQCVREGWPSRLLNQSSEGCRASGHFSVAHSTGDFHFAPGESFEARINGKHVHVHDMTLFKGAFDFSHRIYYLRFGDSADAASMKKNKDLDLKDQELSEPLSGVNHEATDST